MADTDNELIVDVEESEITSAEGAAEVVTTDQATVLLSLEELIKNHIQSLEKLQDDLKKHREMFADAFENSEAYREHEKRVKEVTKEKSQAREQIIKQPAMQSLAQKIKDFNTDLKEKKAALSDYLLEYQRMSGATEIEGHDGKMRDIVNNAKLIKRSSREVADSERK
jgi:hypothetical protein